MNQIGPIQTQPYNRIVWPWESGGSGTLVYDVATALKLPSVGKAIAWYAGLIKQMSLNDVKAGVIQLPRPAILEQLDPERGNAWMLGVLIEDYLAHGNAVTYVTSRDATGWPSSCAWVPAQWLNIAWNPADPQTPKRYLLGGTELDIRNVIHVQRGADRWCPVRGVGVVEQHLGTLDRVALEEQYEREALRNGAVPSVAVITPNPRLGDDEASDAKAAWLDKFGGGKREPAILPNGTQVIPLAWSPEDAQLTQARQMSLVDVANAFNMDSYWLNAPTAGLTYQSPEPNYTNAVRTSINPVVVDFEDMWSMKLLPRGHRVAFDRNSITKPDFSTAVKTVTEAMAANLMDEEEGRAYLGLPPRQKALPQGESQ